MISLSLPLAPALSGASRPIPNQVFTSVLIGLIILLVLLVSKAVQSKEKDSGAPSGPEPASGKSPRINPNTGHERTEKEKEENGPVLLGSLARKEIPVNSTKTVVVPSREGGGKSIDTSYAEKHGQWICRYCETMNDDSLDTCQVCGSPRN